ncbi:sensor histidine kinase [Roseibium aggregatum]|uniref:C4-dicarboxylate transport sensor protein DctB n=1 Tax=Roseibium aggregatum TaxID=187304 RepID=A0A939J6R0_9HYPH|nr:ATP-binding protein [Roseibium aggregatum]MBN9673049.1 sensor histidine kinase [Roseibium aggregatum]
MRNREKRKTWRAFKIGIAAAMALATVAILALTGLASLRITLAEQQTRAEANLAVQTAVLERLLDKFRLLPPLLARGSDSIDLLNGEGGAPVHPGIAAIAAGMSGAEEIWLMDMSGRVVVSSQETVPSGGIGGAEKIPQAFDQARHGQLGRELILGTPETAANYVFASPLRRDGVARGVLAVRVSLEDVEQAWALSKEPIVALDRAGRIVVTNVSHWRGRYLSEVGNGPRFGELSPIGRLKLLLTADGVADNRMQLTQNLPVLGWEVRTLIDTADARQRSGFAMLVALLVCVIAAGGIWFLILRREEFDRQERRNRAEALRLERRVRSRTAELRKANVLLEQEVREREQAEANLRLTQAELVQAAKLATLGRMSAALSHEYNQPLAAIRSDAEIAGMLIERGRAVEAQANLTRIGGMVARMAEIAKTLKGFTRKSGTDIKPVSLRQVIDEALLLLQPQIKQSGIGLNLDLPEEDIIVKGGHIRLEQVVINLLSNALDAVAAQPAPDVRLSLCRENREAVLRVSDNGPGIAEDAMPQIFDPFFTTKKVGAGLGLGLSIAYKIVHDFSGTLKAANREDGGAEFTMRLPVAENRLQAAE